MSAFNNPFMRGTLMGVLGGLSGGCRCTGTGRLMRGQHGCCRQYPLKRANGFFGLVAKPVCPIFVGWIDLNGKADMTILDDDA